MLDLITMVSAMGLQEEINTVKKDVPTIHETEEEQPTDGFLAHVSLACHGVNGLCGTG